MAKRGRHARAVRGQAHEVFGDTGRRIRRDIGETGWVVALGHDDHGVLHRAMLSQDSHGLRDGGGTLPYRAIYAHDVLATLVENGVDGDGGFAGLTVAQDQLALAAPDGDERVDDLDTGLQWHGDWRTVHDRGGRPLYWETLPRLHRAARIERPAERVDDAPEQCVANDHVHDAACAGHFVAGVQVRIIAKQNDANFGFVNVEGEAQKIAGKCQQFFEAHAGQTGYLGDAG